MRRIEPMPIYCAGVELCLLLENLNVRIRCITATRANMGNKQVVRRFEP